MLRGVPSRLTGAEFMSFAFAIASAFAAKQQLIPKDELRCHAVHSQGDASPLQ